MLGSSGRSTTRSTFSLLLFSPALLPPQQKPLRRPLSLSHCPPGAFRLAQDPPAFRKSLQASATEPELPKQQETRTRLLLLSAPGLKFNNPCSSINTAPGAQLCRASHREPRGRGCSELGAGGGTALLPSWQAASCLACCSSGRDPQGLVPCSALSCLAQQLQEPLTGPGAPVLPLCDPHAPAWTGCARHWHREQRHMGTPDMAREMPGKQGNHGAGTHPDTISLTSAEAVHRIANRSEKASKITEPKLDGRAMPRPQTPHPRAFRTPPGSPHLLLNTASKLLLSEGRWRTRDAAELCVLCPGPPPGTPCPGTPETLPSPALAWDPSGSKLQGQRVLRGAALREALADPHRHSDPPGQNQPLARQSWLQHRQRLPLKAATLQACERGFHPPASPELQPHGTPGACFPQSLFSWGISTPLTTQLYQTTAMQPAQGWVVLLCL